MSVHLGGGIRVHDPIGVVDVVPSVDEVGVADGIRDVDDPIEHNGGRVDGDPIGHMDVVHVVRIDGMRSVGRNLVSVGGPVKVVDIVRGVGDVGVVGGGFLGVGQAVGRLVVVVGQAEVIGEVRGVDVDGGVHRGGVL